jgi:two-component system sensor kinase FixL
MQANTTVEILKKEFQFTLSKFSHELRNPISIINSELQMLASSHPEITDYECWENIMENLEYIKELLDDFSNYDKAGKVSFSATALSDYLNAILISVKPTFDYLGIELETDIPKALPSLPIDRIRMRQALLNLLRNAQESISGPNGKITVQADCIQNRVCISITDNGCGISPEQLTHIFSPFITYKAGGTGLGLSVTKQVIEAHGGSIKAESILGQGSVFRIFLG